MMSNATLHEDMIIEIMLRLPVRSLLRFKCVSKSWLSLISDPQFAKSHFDLAAAPTHRFLFKLWKSSELNSIDLEAEAPLQDDSANVIFKIPFPSPAPKDGDWIDVIGSCRGFVLLCFMRLNFFCFVLWNPSTGLQKQILDEQMRKKRMCDHLFGFGYDASTDDYVIVNVTLSGRNTCTNAQCFSLRANSWSSTEITSLHHEALKFGPGLFLNGTIHWLAKPTDNVTLIIAFDVMERRLSEIPLPHDLAIELEFKIYHLMVREECLCLCSLGWKSTMCMPEIWTMREYKVHSSWIKSFVPCINYYNLFTTFFPVCFIRNREILASNGGKILVRLGHRGELLEHRTYWQQVDRYYTLVQSVMYRESLLSLPR